MGILLFVFFSFEWLLVGFGSGCRLRAKERILIFNGKSRFRTLVEMEKSYGLQCEQLLWFSFLYSCHFI